MKTNEGTDQAAQWLTQGTPEAADQLQELAETTGDKDTRKAARRALYLLSQRGVMPQALRSNSPATRAPGLGIGSRSKSFQVEQDGLKAFASAYDGAGNRMVLLTWPDPDGGSPTFSQALLHDEEGVKDIATRRLARRELAERLEGFMTQLEDGIATAEVEPDYGRFLLHQARDLSQQRRQQTPPGFVDLLRVIGEPRRDYLSSPAWSVLSAEEVQADADLPRDPAELFRAVWFEAWFLDVNEMFPWLQSFFTERISALRTKSFAENTPANPADNFAENLTEDSSSDSPTIEEKKFEIENSEKKELEKEAFEKDGVAVNFAEAEQRGLANTAKEAARALFQDEMRARYARRLEETADILTRRNQTEIARQALFHALELRGAATGAESPFAVLLVQRTLQVAMEMKRA